MRHLLFGTFIAAVLAACAASTGTVPLDSHPLSTLESAGGTRYDGCTIFTSGPYSATVTNAAVDSNSSQVLGGLANDGGAASIYGSVNGRWETVNIANGGNTPTPTATISGHNAFGLTGTTQIPWDFKSFLVEDWPDGHALVLDTKACQEWETFHTQPDQAQTTIATGGGYFWNLNTSYGESYPGEYKLDVTDTADASGLSFFAGMVKWNGEMDQTPPVINHALNFSYPAGQGVSQWGYVFPADAPTTVACTVANSGSPPSPCPATSHVMHYGDHFRLKASVACPSQSLGLGQPYAVCQAMKTYGLIFGRKGNKFSLIFASADDTTDNPYQYTDLDNFLNGITLDTTHFDLLKEPPLQCGGKPCPP